MIEFLNSTFHGGLMTQLLFTVGPALVLTGLWLLLMPREAALIRSPWAVIAVYAVAQTFVYFVYMVLLYVSLTTG